MALSVTKASPKGIVLRAHVKAMAWGLNPCATGASAARAFAASLGRDYL